MDFLHQQVTISTSDIVPFIATICAYAVYRYVFMNVVLRKWAMYVKRSGRKINVTKFINRVFDLVHYSLSALFGCMAISSRPYAHCIYWAWDCQDYILQLPDIFVFSRLEKIYFFIFFSYYIVDAFYLYTQTDWITISIHHVATITLVAGSIYERSPNIAIIIMLLHDIVDIPLYAGKILKYLGSWIADVCLLVFAALCTYFRMFNYLIITIRAFQNHDATTYHHYEYIVLTYFLALLYLCHCVWFYDILKAAYGLFIKGDVSSIRDNRSDSA